MTNEIKDLQIQNSDKLLKIYTRRLEQVKKSIIELAKSGGDTTKLALEKKRLEQIIKNLKEEFKSFSDEAIEQTYKTSQQEQKKRFKALDIVAVGLFTINGGTATVQNIFYTHLLNITNRMDNKLKNYVRTDFSDKQATANALNNLLPPQSGIKPLNNSGGINKNTLKDKNKPSGGTEKGLNKGTRKLNNLTDKGLLSSQVDQKLWQHTMSTLEKNLKGKDIFTIPYKNKDGKVIRNVKASTYAEMLARTMTANMYRKAAKDNILKQFGEYGDLVEIQGKSVYPDSPCIPYEGQVLSLEGQTKGYTTIKQAESTGLFHPNCIHWFAVTDNIISIYNKEYPIIEHFSKANVLAREAQNAVYKKGMKKGEFQKKAVEYLYKNIPKNRKENIFVVGELNNSAKTLLKAETSKIYLSLESLAKNIIKHSDLGIEDYIKMNDILANPLNIEPDKNSPEYNIILHKKEQKYYRMVVKTTRDRKENYITSYRRTEK